ncbi:MAG: hypothetical protein HMLKMBBP_03540 [Planctomycetes bacterium]|nr:hypothetical protein [Planctomycetota bacterium]
MRPMPRTPAVRSVPAALLAVAGTAFALTASALTARADEVLLVNGGKLEGKARTVGSEVVIDTGSGEIRLAKDEVKQIVPGKTRKDLYAEKSAALDAAGTAKDPAKRMELADWCRDQKLADLEKKELRTVLVLDPDHEGARARLGYVRSDGRWMTEDEYRLSRGFVKVGTEWIAKEELERRRAIAEAERAQKEHVKTIRDCIAKMQSPLRKPRAEGKLALIRYAEKIGDTGLADFAGKVAAFYNESWRQVKAEQDAATATVTVRATKSELKRPIPTVSTSLGAFSTPVTIQLPELSIMSVNSTVRVPIKIELDEE